MKPFGFSLKLEYVKLPILTRWKLASQDPLFWLLWSILGITIIICILEKHI